METKLTKLLGIKYPIIQSGMAGVANTALAVAVCNAGGLGILAAAGQSAEELRKEIQDIRRLTNSHPFAVNLVPVSPRFSDQFRVVLDEQVPILCSGIRNPFTLTDIRKPSGIMYIPTVGSVKQAVSVEKSGADAVIVQGWEGGGHASAVASTVLIPEAAEAVNIPVIGAGGFCDGKGLAAALMLGAEGIAMGTRFAITRESPIPDKLKSIYIQAKDSDAVLSAVWDGFPMRVLRGEKMLHYRGWWTHPWDLVTNFFSSKKAYNASWGDMISTVDRVRLLHASLPQFLIGMETNRKSIISGDIRKGFAPAGQVVGRIRDIPTCQELIERIAAEAEQVINENTARTSLPKATIDNVL